MEALKRHEIFEVEVLDRLGKSGILKSLIFGGGTMLRLCHELPRYSVDLDFWFSKRTRYDDFYLKLHDFFKSQYELIDSKNKHFTLLYEFRSKLSPRKLKVEIRKEVIRGETEDKIAYSKHGSGQVLVRVLSLEEMVRRKLLAIRSRDEIRDYFDLEFLLRKSTPTHIPKKDRQFISQRVHEFKAKDYSSILGSLLDADLRRYYTKNKFTVLLQQLAA